MVTSPEKIRESAPIRARHDPVISASLKARATSILYRDRALNCTISTLRMPVLCPSVSMKAQWGSEAMYRTPYSTPGASKRPLSARGGLSPQ